MALALRQSSAATSGAAAADYLEIGEVVKLTGKTLRTIQVSAKAHWSVRGLAQLRPPSSGRGKPTWWIHRSVDPKLARCIDRDTRQDRDTESLREKYPNHLVDRALLKAHWLTQWRQACLSAMRGETKLGVAKAVVNEAKQAQGDGFKISVRSLQAWDKAYEMLAPNGHILGVAGLVDGYGSQTQTSRTPEAIEYFYALYRTQTRHSVKTCHDTTLREARRSGWSWASVARSTQQWLQRYDDLGLTCLMREGRKVWSQKFMSFNEIDYSQLSPGSFYVADHTQCDFWVAHDGNLIRPWLTTILDCRSRCVVGWHFGPSPHQDSIMASFRMAFRDWAIPKKIRIDNGKDFTAKRFTGVTKNERNALRRAYGANWKEFFFRNDHLQPCDKTDTRWLGVVHELGIELIFAIPYAAWSKGIVERWYGTFHNQCGKTFSTYCGNSVITRPDYMGQIRQAYKTGEAVELQKTDGDSWKKRLQLRLIKSADIPTLDEARPQIAEYIERYHRSAHSSLNGASPLTVWQTATSVRKAAENELLCILNVRGEYKVGPNGVRFAVGGQAFGYGGNCGALQRLKGRKVLIVMDDADASQCWAYTNHGDKRELISRLSSNDRIPVDTPVEMMRDVVKEKIRQRAIMKKSAGIGIKASRTAAQRIRAKNAEQLTELMATGTNDHQPNIIPVRTGFEDASSMVRVSDDFEPFDPDDGSIEDLFQPDERHDDVMDDLDEDMDVLFSTEAVTDDDDDDGIESLL